MTKKTDEAPTWMPPFRGLIHVTGEPDTGKTTFCLTVPGTDPGHILFFDDDLKTNALAEELDLAGTPFMGYHNLTEEFKLSGRTRPIEYFYYVRDLVEDYILQMEKAALPRAQVAVFDNWTRLESGIRAHSEEIMTQISNLSPGQIRAMSQMTWTSTYEEYARFLSRILSLAPMVFITTHTREKWGSPGVLESRGQRPIIEKSTMRIWLRHNPDSPAPIGLVLKRIHKMTFAPGKGLVPVNVLPRRIKPCTWEKIYDYFSDPVADRRPEKHEMPDAFELSILDGTLTDDQKDALHLARLNAEKEASGDMGLEATEDVKTAEAEMQARAREMKAGGKSLPEIVAEFGGAVTPAQVAGWTRGM